MSTQARGLPVADRLWLGAIAAAVLIVIGSVTPWVSVPRLDVSASGTDGDSDGILTVVLAVAAGVSLLVLPRRRSIPAACGLLALGVATYDVVQILQVGNPILDVNVGWGLMLVVVASVALVLTACVASPMLLPGRLTGGAPRSVAPVTDTPAETGTPPSPAAHSSAAPSTPAVSPATASPPTPVPTPTAAGPSTPVDPPTSVEHPGPAASRSPAVPPEAKHDVPGRAGGAAADDEPQARDDGPSAAGPPAPRRELPDVLEPRWDD